MWLNIRSEYSFKAVYAHLDQIAKRCAELGDYGGIADIGNTFGHVRWRKACKKVGIKPIYGVRLNVVDTLQRVVRRYPYNQMTFIAQTTAGLQQIYELTDLSNQQFYYRPRITYDQVNQLYGVIVLSGVAPRWDSLNVLKGNIYQELGPHTPISERKHNKPSIACVDNFYINIGDEEVYEPFAYEVRGGLMEQKTTPIHIMTEKEWMLEFPGRSDAISNLKNIADSCNVELPEAPMVKYIGKDDIKEWCKHGAYERGIDIQEGEYADRYKREIDLIIEKDYADYFLVVGDLIRYAKTKMTVGPARGSSAGSLVCYLMGITEIDPLKYDLYFERFIDVNRSDMPDIDIDFQDDKRHLCLKYLEKKYGVEYVAQIGNISRMKPRSAIDRFSKALNIPIDDVQELKDSIIDRSGGDARANLCMEDTFNDTDIGKKFLEKHTKMGIITKIEAHALHTGVHAAGILVCNDLITSYCGVNSRPKDGKKQRIAMIDKKDAEAINLLKIDALGLRTLSILASVCDQIGKPYHWLYEISVDDDLSYKVFNDQRYNGIFQFEGTAVNSVAKEIYVKDIEDISAISALGRPGPLSSHGTKTYIELKTGKEAPKYISNHPIVVDATKYTFGVVIYQEQVMKIVRELGKLSWGETSEIRKAMSKSLGVEFFDKLYLKFKAGCIENGLEEKESKKIWDQINKMGSWSFNKSHAISYGLISYLCAYMKAHYPLEFTVACLNHSRADQSALKILRDAVENDGIKYKYIDSEKSIQKWSVQDGLLYGGLVTIDGIGPVAANKVVKFRKTGEKLPKGIQNKMDNGISVFKYLYPAKQLYGDFYSDPKSHGLNNKVYKIKDAQENGTYNIIGCMVKKVLRDSNEPVFLAKRKGKYETGKTSWLNITIEDDTGTSVCKINRDDYERLGKPIADFGKENKDWYLIHGKRINGWQLIFVKNIIKITRKI